MNLKAGTLEMLNRGEVVVEKEFCHSYQKQGSQEDGFLELENWDFRKEGKLVKATQGMGMAVLAPLDEGPFEKTAIDDFGLCYVFEPAASGEMAALLEEVAQKDCHDLSFMGNGISFEGAPSQEEYVKNGENLMIALFFSGGDFLKATFEKGLLVNGSYRAIQKELTTQDKTEVSFTLSREAAVLLPDLKDFQ